MTWNRPLFCGLSACLSPIAPPRCNWPTGWRPRSAPPPDSVLAPRTHGARRSRPTQRRDDLRHGCAIALVADRGHGRGARCRIRPIPLTRKNALFAGSTDGAKTWARIASLIGTCKLNGVNPEAYIAATLRKILDNHMQRDIAELMPWNFSE